MNKYRHDDILPIVECVLDFSIKKLLRLIYCSINHKGSGALQARFSSSVFDKSMIPFDTYMGKSIAGFTNDRFTIEARNCLIVLIEYNRDFVLINTFFAGRRSYSKMIVYNAGCLFGSFQAQDLDGLKDPIEKLEAFINWLPYLIYWLCKLIIYGELDLANVFHTGREVEDIPVGFDLLSKYNYQEVAMLTSLKDEILKYSGHK